MDDRQLNSHNNWSESVEDLLSSGDTDAAISLLQSVISDLEAAGDSDSGQLASALDDLATLFSSRGFSLKADHLRSRASLIRTRFADSRPLRAEDSTQKKSRDFPVPDESPIDGNLEKTADSRGFVSPVNEDAEDDWEAFADRSADGLLSSQCLPGVSDLSLEDNKSKTPKRRGRGAFLYKKPESYGDHSYDNSVADNLENEGVFDGLERNTETRHSTYGTRHVLLLADFSPSTKTIDLERLFADFSDRGVVIRWINDTTALAVFRTPSIALEAKNRVRCSFTVRILDKDDELLSSISPKDLEPPKQRPKTSARTAQRMIAVSMGLKLPSTSFGSRELRKQESDRKSRITSRQKLKDDAWGDD